MGSYNLFPAWTVQCQLCKALKTFPSEAAADRFLKSDKADFPHYGHCPYKDTREIANGQ